VARLPWETVWGELLVDVKMMNNTKEFLIRKTT
jgi:hypothetical protein